VFAYLGEGEPPPIRRYPDFEAAAGLAVGGWAGGTANPSAYTIQLVGASFCDSAVPTGAHSWSRVKIIYR